METYTLDIKGGLPIKLTAEHTLGDLEGIDKKRRKPHWGPHLFRLKSGEMVLYIGLMHSCGQHKNFYGKLYRNVADLSSENILQIFGNTYSSHAMNIIKALGLPTEMELS
tara:strand:- start:4 stop:333 length:330 start_codon:yes stop_codon:yes gene_type:complete